MLIGLYMISRKICIFGITLLCAGADAIKVNDYSITHY